MCPVLDRFERAAGIFRDHGGILRMAEAVHAGVSRSTLYAMLKRGLVERLSRGTYRLTSLPELSQPDFVTVAARIPSGVVCLLSALQFHGLTTHVSHSIDMAVLRGAEKPRLNHPPVNVFWFSRESFSHGIVSHAMDGRTVRIYSAEKSIADMFKYRNKLGVDIAIETLRTWCGRRGANIQGLLESARICRVERVIRPYLEALTCR